MSLENANVFLKAAAQHAELREKFNAVENPTDFLTVAKAEGYDFTTEELQIAVKELSKGVLVRRKTGVWPWLRNVKWI